MPARRRSWHRPLWVILAVVVPLTACYRFLALGEGFPNDHFVYITGGWQMLFGEWPTRDWVDPGLPLMFLSSAVAQRVFGTTLFAEALLVSVAFGVGAALTVAAVKELTGSTWLAVLVGVLEVVAFPRTYSYPKVLAYAAAFFCYARFVRQPSPRRSAAIAVAVAVAFLFRHDHGLFLGIGGMLTIVMAPQDSARARAHAVAVFTAACAGLVAPYLVYVQVHGGVLAYLRTGLDFSEREAARQWHVWPRVIGDPDPLMSLLVYQLYALPLLVLVVLMARRADARAAMFRAQVVPTALVALMVNYSFVRDPLVTRLPDAIVPALILGAWLLGRAVEARGQWLVRAIATCCTLLVAASVAIAGDLTGNLDRTDVFREWDHLPRLFRTRSAELQERVAAGQLPSRAMAALVPFLSYLDRCTTPEHRLIVGGYLVELPFFAQRRFASGQAYFGGSFGGDEGQRRALRRLRTQVAPFAVIPSDYASDMASHFGLVNEYLRTRYTTLTRIPATDELDIEVLVDSTLPPRGRDPATGWPCFR